MKKTLVLITSLALSFITLVSCGKNENSNTADTVNDSSKKEISSEVKEDSIYIPSEGEHRFADILNEINQNRTISIELFNSNYGKKTNVYTYDGSDIMCYSQWFDENRRDAAGFYETLNAFVLKKHSEPYSDGGFPAYFFDPDTKVYFEIPMADNFESGEPAIIENFSPEKWSFVSSGTTEVAGKEYYCETYQFNTEYLRWVNDRRETVVEKNVIIAFDGNGKPVYLEDTKDAEPVDDLTTLDQIFWNPDDSGDGHAVFTHLIKSMPHYGQYVDFSISAEADMSQFSLNGYTKIAVSKFADMVKNAISDSIDEELGLD